jgi:hypothetical protein
MTRRSFLSMIPGAALLPAAAKPAVIVPVHFIFDGLAKLPAEQVRWFWSRLWAEAARDFARGGIRFESSIGPGEVWRPQFREPVVSGLESRALNVVLTSRIPLDWDNGRAWCGITTLYRGRHLCMIALERAHCDQVPLLSVNTCVHELLHALLLDIYVARPTARVAQAHEFRVDWCATRLWLFGDGSGIRKSAEAYVRSLQTAPG